MLCELGEQKAGEHLDQVSLSSSWLGLGLAQFEVDWTGASGCPRRRARHARATPIALSWRNLRPARVAGQFLS